MKDKYRLNVMGAVRLETACGRDLTPKGGMKRALLAYLALTRGPRTRLKLQEMFWGMRQPEQAATSLRNALSSLRSELKNSGVDLLKITNQTVDIRHDLIAVDVDQFRESMRAGTALDLDLARLPDLLEGLDIPSAAAQEFEEWLSLERRLWSHEIDQYLNRMYHESKMSFRRSTNGLSSLTLPDTTPGAEGRDCARRNGFIEISEEDEGYDADAHKKNAPSNRVPPNLATLSIGLRAPTTDVDGETYLAIGHSCLDQISAVLQAEGVSEIFDLRHEQFDQASDSQPKINLLIVTRLIGGSKSPRLNLQLINAGTLQIYWQSGHDLIGTNIEHQTKFSAHSSQAILRTLNQLHEFDTTGIQIQSFNILGRLFSISKAELPDLSTQLKTSFDQTSDPIVLALVAYLNTFRVGEHWGGFDQNVIHETEKLIQQALNLDSKNPVLLALVGHAAWYVCHDFDMATDLLRLSVEIAPAHSICCDHLALNHLYRGTFADGLLWANRAAQYGRFSNLRHIYSTTRAMALILSGNQDQGTMILLSVLRKHPEFAAARRYVILGLGELGRWQEATEHLNYLKGQDRAFSLKWFSGNRLAMIKPEIEDRFTTIFKEVGLT